MTRKLLLALSSLWFSAIFVFSGAPSAFPSEPTMFVDCDGDGFDDNAPDDDADGIPDEYEPHKFITAPSAQLAVSQLLTGGDLTAAQSARPRCSEGFGRRMFVTRSVREDRLDFDAGFGASLGLGGGLGSGGGCAGGVCL